MERRGVLVPEIMLCKRQPIDLTDSERETLRTLLFKSIRGFTDDDNKSWRRFWKQLFRAELGELFKFTTVFIRNGRFHRKMFALLNLGFDAWEPPRKHHTYKGHPVQKNFDQFREDVVIAAGFYEQTFDLHGRMRLRAKSLSYAKMDEAQFEQVYSAVLNVLLEGVLLRYGSRENIDKVVDQLMRFA